MKLFKKRVGRVILAIISLLSLALLGFGCGGGGDGGVTPQQEVGTINGIVSGTTIIAVADGEIVASDDTTGKTPDANGNFPFTLTGIPVGKNIRVYLIEEGGIFPLYFDIDDDGNPDTNVFTLSSTCTIDLGFVNTYVEGQDGKAIPENDPSDNPNVTPETENVDIPTILNQPDTSGLTLSQLITEGLDALKDVWFLRAKAYFEAAVDLAGSDTSNDADTARFFYALTRVAALGFDTYSDGNPDVLNRLGDILDGFGADTSDSNRCNFEVILFPEILPDDSPTGSDFQSFLYDIVRPELEGAIDNFDAISQNFNKQWTEPFDNEMVEIDYGDVLFLRAIFKSTLAFIFTQSAYNLDGDIDKAVNSTGTTIEIFLNDESEFLALSISYVSDLNAAKTNFDSALEDLDNAIEWMQSELDPQEDDFINLGDSTNAEIIQARADIDDVQNSLNGPTVMNDNEDPNDTDDDLTLDMSFFFAGLDFRDPNLLPPFTENEVTGLFPDPTFDGILGSEIDLNEDIDPEDDIPDIFQ
jgi:hypothetical protein